MALHGMVKSVLRLLPRIIPNLLSLLLIPEQIPNLHASPLLAVTPTMPAIVVLGHTKLSHHCAAEGRIYRLLASKRRMDLALVLVSKGLFPACQIHLVSRVEAGRRYSVVQEWVVGIQPDGIGRRRDASVERKDVEVPRLVRHVVREVHLLFPWTVDQRRLSESARSEHRDLMEKKSEWGGATGSKGIYLHLYLNFHLYIYM